MSGRNAFEIKKLILSALDDGKPHSYAQLERSVNSNWQTIRDHCKELELFGCVIIGEKASHDRNNKPYFAITMTKAGREVLKKLK